MSTAIPLRNVIGKAVHILLVRIIPLQTDLDANPVFTLTGEVEYLANLMLVAIQVLNEAA